MEHSVHPILHARVSVGSLCLHVARAGEASKELMLFLHGFPESSASWRRYLHAFARDYFAVAPDNRGFNLSDKPGDVSAYQMDHVVGDILALADYYGGRKIILVGHDWGGIAAWHFAARHPDRIARLVVLNAPHPTRFQACLTNDPAQRAASQYMQRFRDPDCEARLMALGLEPFWDSLFGGQFQQGIITTSDKAAALHAWQQPGALTAMLNWYRASPFEVPTDVTATALPRVEPELHIAAPTLVIWGMQDTLLLPCLLDGLAEFVPQLTIERIDDTGHGLIHEKPAKIIAIIRAWLAEN